MPNFGGVAYKANPKAKTGGASPYDSTTVQKPPVHTRGSFNPANATDNFTAASTKGAIRANPGARTARGAKPFA
jgi:hypothetical protein